MTTKSNAIHLKDCPICGAFLKKNAEYPWHLSNEDCRNVKKPVEYEVRKHGDNYGLFFRGSLVESGIFATRKAADKHKAIAEHERKRGGEVTP